MSEFKNISVEKLADLLNEVDVELIDVRTEVEFREVHVENALNVPLDRLNETTVRELFASAGEKPVYMICNSGRRSEKACQVAQKHGFENVINVEGGTKAWVEAGLPVIRGKKAISLERQVRITAGLIVFVGAILGIFLNKYFAGISAFVGAGFMFAGITDTCAMGMLISKMPWNQVRHSADCQVPQSKKSHPVVTQ